MAPTLTLLKKDGRSISATKSTARNKPILNHLVSKVQLELCQRVVDGYKKINKTALHKKVYSKCI